jgi:hypothetical protein
MKDVESVFPDHLAGFGVEAQDALLFALAFAGVVDHEQPALHEQRRRAAAERRGPDKVAALSACY